MRTKAIRFGVSGLAVDDVAREAGRLLDGVRGRDPGIADMLIAATDRGLTLLIRNVRDFDGCGVEVVDLFEGMDV